MRRNVLAALVGNGTYAASQFVILLLISRTTSPTIVGQYAFALALSAPVFLLLDLKLRIVQVTDAAGKNRAGDFFGLRFVTTGIALAVVALMAAVFPFDRGVAALLLAVAAYKAAESINDIYYGAMQRLHHLPMIARSQVLRACVTVAIVGTVLLSTQRVVLAIASSALAMGLLAWLTARRVRTLDVDTAPRFRGADVMWLLVRTALPAGLSVCIGSMFSNVPKYFVRGSLGDAQLGVFAVLGYGLVVTALVAQGIAEAVLPRLADFHAAGDHRAFRRTIRLLVVMGALIGMAGLVLVLSVGEVLLRVTFGSAYAEPIDALALLMVAGTVQYIGLFLAVAMNAMRMFMIELPINIIGTLSLIPLCMILVPHGLNGAALAILGAQCVITGGYVILYLASVRPQLTGTKT
jgi:O-antigen/teichoic acid export membrane protein